MMSGALLDKARRRAVTLGALALFLAPVGCARDHARITPTTSGTDLRAMPRGRMIPQPFPGSSLARTPARAGPEGPAVDPDAITASAGRAPR